MKAVVNWKEGMEFSAESEGNIVTMDAKAPLGHHKGMTPKELVAAGLAGCTAMDVIALMKKHKQPCETFQVEVDISQTEGHPVVFKEVHLFFKVTGAVDPKILLDSIALSQTKYCGVSAMLSKVAPITYTAFVNGEEVGTGKAEFGGPA
ncbi:MAG: OsmC family protein [Pseudobdellovibrionaceae bacterium]